jgi:hypothetical protein
MYLVPKWVYMDAMLGRQVRTILRRHSEVILPASKTQTIINPDAESGGVKECDILEKSPSPVGFVERCGIRAVRIPKSSFQATIGVWIRSTVSCFVVWCEFSAVVQCDFRGSWWACTATPLERIFTDMAMREFNSSEVVPPFWSNVNGYYSE